MEYTRNCTTTVSSTIPSKTAAPINASTSTITHFHDEEEEEAQDAQLHLVERAFEADPKARSSDEWGEFMGAPYVGTRAQGCEAYDKVIDEIVTRPPPRSRHTSKRSSRNTRISPKRLQTRSEGR